MLKRRDEEYVIDLCDEILQRQSLRQYRGFDFLLGDSGRKLPVDAYYEDLSLVIEYHERQHTEALPHFDKPDRLTVSGVPRGEQRKLYDQRRRDLLPSRGFKLIEISYNDFDHTKQKRLIKNSRQDRKVLEKILSSFVKK